MAGLQAWFSVPVDQGEDGGPLVCTVAFWRFCFVTHLLAIKIKQFDCGLVLIRHKAKHQR